jgi:nucleotide-binding universal stress UspA family protein
MKILLAIDDSKSSQAAIKAVMTLARPKETEVRVLHVIEPFPLYPDGQAWGYGLEASQVLEEQREGAEGLAAKAQSTTARRRLQRDKSNRAGKSKGGNHRFIYTMVPGFDRHRLASVKRPRPFLAG